MPDKAGAFLTASKIICKNGGNIVRVNYNKAVDIHTLFIDVSADEKQHERISLMLRDNGYLIETSLDKQIILIVLKLPDKVGAVAPVLEIINNYNVNISYISSQENGTPFQYFKMGLLIENTSEIKCLLDDVSKLCEVKILEYDVTEKNLDGTVFYIEFANEMREILNLSQEQTNSVIINSNKIMQILDERNESPLKTFDYIKRFAKFISDHRGEHFNAHICKKELSDAINLYIIQPPCGSNTYIFENRKELLFIDCGFACFKDEMQTIYDNLFSDFSNYRKSLLITHADIDHTGLLDMFSTVYMNQNCYDNFLLEQNGEPNFREQNMLHSPYCTLSKIISGYTPPSLNNSCIIGSKSNDTPISIIGNLTFGSLYFDIYESCGGHVKGETIIVCKKYKLIFTGDILVNIEGFSEEQRQFNLLAPYLMTSVNVDSEKAKYIRKLILKHYQGYTFYPGHGDPVSYPLLP